MRNPILTLNGCGLVAAAAVCLFSAGPARAVLPVLPAGERVWFTDDFDNNDNDWSRIGPGNTEATIGADPFQPEVTCWYSSVTNVSASFPGVWSLKRLPVPLNVAMGDISVFMRVRVDYATVSSAMGENNKFTLVLAEDNGLDNAIAAGTNALAQLIIKPCAPTAPARLGFTALTNDTPTNNFEANLSLVRMPDTNTYVDFCLKLALDEAGFLRLTAWRYDTTNSTYILLGPPVTDAWAGSGLFSMLQIMARNGGTRPDKRAYFDSVAITQSGPRLRQVGWANGRFGLSFSGYAGNSYAVEFRRAFGAGDWTTLLTTNGTGGLLRIEDPGATDPQRFYRVRWD